MIALVRGEQCFSPSKVMESLLFMFVSSNHLLGDLSDHASFVKAIKQVDVVICTMGSSHQNLGRYGPL
ncbi:hypothetical protein HN51_006895 [Arachis hypogaea]